MLSVDDLLSTHIGKLILKLSVNSLLSGEIIKILSGNPLITCILKLLVTQFKDSHFLSSSLRQGGSLRLLKLISTLIDTPQTDWASFSFFLLALDFHTE